MAGTPKAAGADTSTKMLKEFKPEVEALLGSRKTELPVKATAPQSDVVILQRFSYLQLRCLAHRYLYYVKTTPVISDQEYDKLERELVNLCESFPKLWDDSEFRDCCPTESVGSSMKESYPDAAKWLAQNMLMEYYDMRQYINKE